MGVLPVERASLLLNLVLVVDYFKDAGSELSADLAQHSVGFEGLNDEVFEVLHVVICH